MYRCDKCSAPGWGSEFYTAVFLGSECPSSNQSVSVDWAQRGGQIQKSRTTLKGRGVDFILHHLSVMCRVYEYAKIEKFDALG